MFRILKSILMVAVLATVAIPADAKFLQPDWFEVTKPGVGTNRYAYCNNDPINCIDPGGNQSRHPDEMAAEAEADEDAFSSFLADPNISLEDKVEAYWDIEVARAKAAAAEAQMQDNARVAIGTGMLQEALTKLETASRMQRSITGSKTGAVTAARAALKDGGFKAGITKAGQAGGPGAGKAFSEKTKNQARKESDNTCAFCGVTTVRSKTPQPNRSNTDHAIAKSRGGNNTIDNAQNTCQSCNLEKGTRSTGEYLDILSKQGRRF